MKLTNIAVAGAVLLSPVLAFGQNINVNVNANVKAGDTEVKAETKTEAKAEVKSESSVRAQAREVRGWDETEKKDFLVSVKSQAQLKSSQDLDNFAKGVMIKDENVAGVQADESAVEVRYKLPAKFLGIFESNINAITNVSFETNKQGRGPKEVTVRFPWYRMFFSLSTSTREEILQTAIDKTVQVEAQTPRDNTYAQNGTTINLISNILKGIRAEVKASASTSVN